MLARLAWRMPHEAAIDGCLKSGDVFEGAEREDRVLNIRRGGSVLKKPKIAPTENYLTNRLGTSDFRTAIIRITELWTFTVASLAPISAAICLLSRPETTRGITSRSRGVSDS